MADEVLVVAELAEGALRPVSLELVSEARRLADARGAAVAAVVLEEAAASAATLGEYGADRVYLVAGAAAAPVSAVEAVARQVDAETILLPASAFGSDLAAALATRLGGALAANCLSVAAEAPTVTRPMYAGKVIAAVEMTARPRVITARPRVFALGEAEGSRQAEVIALPAPEPTAAEALVELVELIRPERKGIELAEAEVIVSGGRGLGGPEAFAMLRELADLLNAAVGASRAAVDAGWMPHAQQVGQTGKQVSPRLYIACGISGAIQHLVGMSSSQVVVAINKDPEAPIFAKCDYGIVGDVFEVVPALTEELKRAGAGG